MSLFDNEPDSPAASRHPLHSSKGLLHAMVPLAERMRPLSLAELLGQEHLVGPGKPLRVQIERDDASSMIFWGPPGVGKTTLAKIIAETTKATFIEFSAVHERHQGDQAGDGRGGESGRVRIRGRFCLWMRFTASTRRSRMHFCLMSSGERSG